MMNRERDTPMWPDTIFHIWSMAKPITCVALMTLCERGCFQLSDPVSASLPVFSDLDVYPGGTVQRIKLVSLARELIIRYLLAHASDLTRYMYGEAGVSNLKPIVKYVDDLQEMPLAFQPGYAWRYSCSYDVVARLIEVMCGETLAVYPAQEVFEPLGMGTQATMCLHSDWIGSRRSSAPPICCSQI
jgi:CubicO group peptidase (beta-lactamase class C family)